MKSNSNRWHSFAKVSISNSSPIKLDSESHVQRFFNEYCSNSSVHGVRYFTERKRHWTERCWWIIAIGLSMWFCGMLIRNVWIKWRDNPVTMAMNEKQLPISTIPFPMITICPEIKTYKEKLDITYLHDLPKEYRVLSKIEVERIQALSHVCVDAYMFDYDEEFANASIFDTLADMAPSLNETVRVCTLKEDDNDTCSELFVPISTEEGLCFSFNALNSNEIYTDKVAPEMFAMKNQPNVSNWNLETGYTTESKDGSYPIRVFSAQKNSALNFQLRSYDEDVEFVCRTLVPGYKLFLHTPGDVLKANDISIRIPFSEEIEISIKPKLITTADGLRTYRPKQRHCFFNSERRLHYFKFYSQSNCKAECLANYTLLQCGCVKFNMPRNESTKICGSAKIECYRRAKEKLFEEDIIGGLTNKKAERFRRKCHCLPSCTVITYEAQVDRTKFYWREALKRTLNWTQQEVNSFHMSSVMIYFDHYSVTSLKREEQYTNTDFLAVCGGLLGLCLGVSALSIIEFLYFLTLRLYWSIYHWKTKKEFEPIRPRHINHILIDMPKY